MILSRHSEPNKDEMTGLFTQFKGLKRENYILFLGKIVTNLGAMIWPMMTLILNQKIGLDATQTAYFIILFGIAFLPANIWGGQIADKFNKKHVIVFCDILSIALYIICAFLPITIYSMCVAMSAAFFQTLEGPAYQALVADITPPEKREKAFSLLYLGSNIGLTLSPTIAGILFNKHLQLCFAICGIAIAVSTVLIGFGIKDIGVTHKEKSEDGSENILGVLKGNIPLILFLIAVSFYEGGYSQFSYLMPLDISKAFPENGSVIYGTVNSLNCMIVVFVTPVVTMFMEKVAMNKKYLLGIVLQILSFGVFLASFGIVMGYYLSITLFTLGEILTATVCGAYISGMVPKSHRGRIHGVMNFASAFMQGVVKWNSGWLFDNYGSSPAWGFSIAMTVISLVVASILVITDREHCREYTEA